MDNKTNTTKFPTEGYVRQSQLLEQVLPISSATLWRMVNSGGFPRPYKLAKRVTAWKWQEVHSWMREQEIKDLA